MSRHYRMQILVNGHHPVLSREIEDIVRETWPVEFVDTMTGSPEKPELAFEGESSLGGGMSEEEFTDRVARAVMQVNGGPCTVTVFATYLDDLPTDQHTRDINDYARLTAFKEGEEDDALHSA